MPNLYNISKKWGNRSIFNNLSIEVPPQKTTMILGKSGVGKTTLLSIIANLCEYEGKVEGFGKVSYVFQEPRLIPFLSVKENLEYSLSTQYNKAELDSIIDKYLEVTNMYDLKNKIASTLSGGEKQRVSLIRAFAYRSETILLDEPFSSIDLGLKMKIIDLFKDLLTVSPKTTVFVTHSIDEALYLGDKIVFLSDNGLVEFYNPTESLKRTYGYESDNNLRKQLYKLFE